MDFNPVVEYFSAVIEDEPLAAWEQELMNSRSANWLPAPVQKKTYIAGPMRGAGILDPPDKNYPAFNAVTKMLRDLGWYVSNPAENFGGDPGREHAEYMRQDLKMLMDSHQIVLLPGWRNSEGATMEAAIARISGYRFYEAYLLDEGADPYKPDSWDVVEVDAPPYIGGVEAKARHLVWGDRDKAYGAPSHDFACTGRKWAATLSAHTGQSIPDIPPEIVAVMMMDLKASRLAGNPTHDDSLTDIIGYALCHWRIVTDDGRNTN